MDLEPVMQPPVFQAVGQGPGIQVTYGVDAGFFFHAEVGTGRSVIAPGSGVFSGDLRSP